MRLNEKITRVKKLMNIKEQFDEPRTNSKDISYKVPTPNSQSLSTLKLPSNYKPIMFDYMNLCDAYQWNKVGLECPDKELLPPVTDGLRSFVTPEGEKYSLWLTKQEDDSWIFNWYYNDKKEPWSVVGNPAVIAKDEEAKERLRLRRKYSISPPRQDDKNFFSSNYFVPRKKTKVLFFVSSNTFDPIKVDEVKFYGPTSKYVTNVIIPQTKLQKGDSVTIEFEYEPENDTNSPIDVKLDIVVVVKIYGKKRTAISEERIILNSEQTIVFEHSIGSEFQVLTACGRKFSKKDFDKAKDWWRNWLNNPVTKNKFQKNWNYTKEKTDGIFEDYLEALDTATLIYTFNEKPNQGWVPGTGSILQFYGITTDGIDYPVYVNCNTNYYDPYVFFVHELQHILNARHEIHPYEDNIFQGQSNSLKKEFKGELSQRSEAAQRTLIENGFDELNTLRIVVAYEYMLNKDIEHLEKSNEILSSLSEVRVSLNLKPGQNLTKQDLIANAKNDEVIIFICQWLYSGEPLQTWLNIMNASAMKKLNPKGTEMV